MLRLFITFYLICISCLLWSQSPGREIININKDWLFHRSALTAEQRKSDVVLWEKIDIPHSYNTTDAFDDEPGYYRGESWYRRILNLPELDKSKKYFLYFEAANQEARLFVNEDLIGDHIGGYTAFVFDITNSLVNGENLIELRVDNSHNEAVPPLEADFTFYGGIYRDVFLITTAKIHFDMSDHASSGIFITTPEVNEKQAIVIVKSTIIDEMASGSEISIRYTLKNKEGAILNDHKNSIILENYENKYKDSIKVDLPVLWSPSNPYLYQLTVELSRSGQVLDRISHAVAFRYFDFDPDEGFFLNGLPLKLIGVNRHQDKQGQGNALSNEDHLADIKLIKQMGANFLRTAHYPQDPAILHACDSAGLLVSMEIPIVNDITDSESFYDNCKNMMREMIRQYHNHPSIIIWAYMNEVGMRKNYRDHKDILQKTADFARVLESLVRKEDPYRYTMIPNHGDFELYHKSGLTEIPMIVGWNLYYGWYLDEFDGFSEFLNKVHQSLPHKSIMVAEYGAGADPRIRSEAPERFDFSVDWQNLFHKSHIRQIRELDYLAASAVWAMFDFGAEHRADAVPYINSKGICTFDRKPKDAYYIYRDSLAGVISLDAHERDVLLDLSIRKNYGAKYTFTSDTLLQWIPEMSAENESCFGGMDFSPRSVGFGTAKPISLSPDDPLYQTQIVAPDSLVFDVFPGYNTIDLLFSELEAKQSGERVFDVVLNDDFIFSNIDLAGQYGQNVAVKKSITIEVKSNPLIIKFIPHKGQAVINAVQVSPNIR